MSNWRDKEKEVRRAIEDRGFEVQDANVLFRANCPNIDLVVFGKSRAIYIQVKSSEVPATKDGVIVDGSPWTAEQLHGGAPIYNKHTGTGHYKAALIVILDHAKTGPTNFYIAPPQAIEELVRTRGIAFAAQPKRDGRPRSINFRKELSREALKPWLNAWQLFGEQG